MADVFTGLTVWITLHDILMVEKRAQTLSRLFNLGKDLLPMMTIAKTVMKAFKEGPLEGGRYLARNFRLGETSILRNDGGGIQIQVFLAKRVFID
jgi:hypothetical protein